MNIAFRIRKTARMFVRLCVLAVCTWGLGVAYVPTALAATPSVAVDQEPLTVQKPLPPNIVLMLDDSGSMAWDYMPDWGYLKNNSDNAALINANNNGVYYNPAKSYPPPPKADSTVTAPNLYPDAPSLTNAWQDGIRQTGGGTDVTRYHNTSDTSYHNHYIYYSTHSSHPVKTTFTATTYKNDSGDVVDMNQGRCDNTSSYIYWQYRYNGNVNESFDASTHTCTITYYDYKYFFQYSTGPKDGPYVVHYVAAYDGECKYSPDPTRCVAADDKSGTAAPSPIKAGQNIANWFSYYRTRMLMTKSGVMSAFSTLDPKYRVGFGSIDGSNTAGLGTKNTDYYPFTTSAGQGYYQTDYDTGVAHVKAFGNGADGTQKKKFWDWLIGTYPNGSTPLRGALDAVGKYYQTKQPWETSDSDSTCHACRLSYTILTTDGFWNGNKPSGIGDVDSKDGPVNKNPAGKTGQYLAALPFMDAGSVTKDYSHKYNWYGSNGDCKQRYFNTTGSYNGYQDSYYYRKGRSYYCGFTYTTTGAGYSDTLADVAMKYWETDLRTDIDNEVPTSPADRAFWQHMTTFTMGLGFDPTGITPSGTSKEDIFNWASGGTSIPGFSWPEPSSDSIKNIADLEHAAVNGHGYFYSAKDPENFKSSLQDALDRASNRNGSGASLAANSTELQTGTFAYQATYYSGVWTGDLKALAVNSTTGKLSDTPTWQASKQLPTASNRDINTYNPDTGAMVAFDKSNLSTAETDALTSLFGATKLKDFQKTLDNNNGGTATDMDTAIIKYLRGDSSNEARFGGPFRNRLAQDGSSTALGDIVDSQPVYVGAPDSNEFTGRTFTGSDTFLTYVSNTSSGTSARAGMIYIASNDGMLHAFDATSGVEKFAYIPSAVLTNGADLSDGTQRGLSLLADPDYGSDTTPGRHQYFNDGELTVADAYFAEGKKKAAWHTVLVGTTGRGEAKAVYALDVTDPTNISLLWEHSAHESTSSGSDYDYIGQMTGKPVVAQTADGEWSVLIANGYNSVSDKAALLQFDLATGALSVHKTDATTGNGLAAPAVWLGDPSNGISTVAYAGDLQGNVWKFNLYDSTNKTSDKSSTGSLVYVARDSGDARQPITGGMLMGRNPDTNDLWIFFGTGRYLAQADTGDTQTQTWYGLIVQSSTSGLAVDSSTKRASLTEQTIIGETTGSTKTTTNPDGSTTTTVTLPARVVSSNSLGTNSGWYLDFTPHTILAADGSTAGTSAEGERMVTPNQFQGSLLVGTTRIPTAADICDPSGTGWVMAIDPFTGGNPSPSFFDINGDGRTDNDTVTIGGKQYSAAGVGFKSIPNNPIFVGNNMLISFDNGDTTTVGTPGSGGNVKRVSWRELSNN